MPVFVWNTLIFYNWFLPVCCTRNAQNYSLTWWKLDPWNKGLTLSSSSPLPQWSMVRIPETARSAVLYRFFRSIWSAHCSKSLLLWERKALKLSSKVLTSCLCLFLFRSLTEPWKFQLEYGKQDVFLSQVPLTSVCISQSHDKKSWMKIDCKIWLFQKFEDPIAQFLADAKAQSCEPCSSSQSEEVGQCNCL